VKRPQGLQLKELKAIQQRLKAIQPFIRISTQGAIRKDSAFLNCFRASLSKAFELCVEAYKGRTNRMPFFFWRPRFEASVKTSSFSPT
jgi:hypothetical protein